MPQISAPTFEHHLDGFGVDHTRPRISWRFSSSPTDVENDAWAQSAYEIEIARGDRTESYRFNTEESVLVSWPSGDLLSREGSSVRVRAYGVKPRGATEWSPWSTVEAALLRREDWLSTPIKSEHRVTTKTGSLQPIRFRKTFPAQSNISKVRLYITAYGVYEAYLNGKKVGNQAFAPGWTSYSHRLNYQIFDITQQVHDGDNVLAVEVGEGWYAGRLTWEAGKRFIYGEDLAVMAQLEMVYENGVVVVVKSDESWKCAPSAIVSSEIYDGEIYDMREEKEAWGTAAFEDSSWMSVKSLPFPTAKLVSPDAPPVRITEKIKPIDIITSPTGKVMIDFGQNLVGVLQIHSLNAPVGQEVSFVHAEVLEDGEAATRPLRTAKCIDTIIGSGKTLKDWSPKFTFHGFRYVQVDGWPGLPTKDNFTALVMHSDMRRRGWFSCSNPLVNKLHENTVWGMRGNFFSVPTDCPQRDERLGWTGDAQIFTPSATFLYDTVGMLSNWLEDVSAEQLAKKCGVPGLVVPDVLPTEWNSTPQAVWHDLVVLTPFDLYKYSADANLLRRQYDSMKIYIDRAIIRGPDNLWDPDVWQLGDWLDPAAPPDEPGNGRTDGVIVADAYLVHITHTMSKICSALGLLNEATKYSQDAEELRAKFQYKYITPHGLLVNNTQTAVSLAIRFELFSNQEQFKTAGSGLARLVRNSQFRIATGFAGTPVICHALTATNNTSLAYRMLLEKHCPSWLYPVTMGATTIWERWDSMLPNGKVNPGSMTSFNHYALGSVVDWLHGTTGGISSQDGWKNILVQPIPGGNLKFAETIFEGPYGRVECKWKIDGTKFEMTLSVPPNSAAIVVLPSSGKSKVVGSGNHLFESQFVPDPWPPEHAKPAFWGTPHCSCGE
jgi:alpha-L-rhamnosidase